MNDDYYTEDDLWDRIGRLEADRNELVAVIRALDDTDHDLTTSTWWTDAVRPLLTRLAPRQPVVRQHGNLDTGAAIVFGEAT